MSKFHKFYEEITSIGQKARIKIFLIESLDFYKEVSFGFGLILL